MSNIETGRGEADERNIETRGVVWDIGTATVSVVRGVIESERTRSV